MVKTRQKSPTEIFDLDAMLQEGEAALDQFPYDTASAHYESDEYPHDLPPDAARTHIGMYLGWMIDKEFISESLKNKYKDVIAKYQKREILPSEVLKLCCNDELTKEHLNEAGNEFSRMYYRPGWTYSYLHDYDVLTGWPDERRFFYLENSWESFEKVKAVIDSRYEEWIHKHNKA